MESNVENISKSGVLELSQSAAFSQRLTLEHNTGNTRWKTNSLKVFQLNGVLVLDVSHELLGGGLRTLHALFQVSIVLIFTYYQV